MTATTDFYLGIMRAYAKRNKNYVDALLREYVEAHNRFFDAPTPHGRLHLGSEEQLWDMEEVRISEELGSLTETYISTDNAKDYLERIDEEDEYSPFSWS